MKRSILLAAALLCAAFAVTANAQQAPDTDFKPPIKKPLFKPGEGPVVLIDEAHFNFHTASGRYQTFADLLRRDGYVVRGLGEKFSKKSLSGGRILVIANPLHESNQSNWSPPNPSAFTKEEIAAVKAWVEAGGALMLIADHLPFPGAAGELAKAFGISFNNGYAFEPGKNGPLSFTHESGLHVDHPILQGRDASERVTKVVTFTGSAFQIEKGEALMTFSPNAVALEPKVFGQGFPPDTPRTRIGNWHQGAVLSFGKGRVAVFGEAAMFSAQLAGPNRAPMGMNAPEASQNPQFLLNVMHWLSQ
ncbi:MAG: DUF4350 domain-containing protein [Acidobacteriota bacterium]|nr:MAG: DUF4350 domain-containing protein [Acidobacteriota bacterium]